MQWCQSQPVKQTAHPSTSSPRSVNFGKGKIEIRMIGIRRKIKEKSLLKRRYIEQHIPKGAFSTSCCINSQGQQRIYLRPSLSYCAKTGVTGSAGLTGCTHEPNHLSVYSPVRSDKERGNRTVSLTRCERSNIYSLIS